jgi:hypothetical protein
MCHLVSKSKYISKWPFIVITGCGSVSVVSRLLAGRPMFKDSIFSPPSQYQLWIPPSLIFSGYLGGGGPFPEGKAAGLWSWPLASA